MVGGDSRGLLFHRHASMIHATLNLHSSGSIETRFLFHERHAAEWLLLLLLLLLWRMVGGLLSEAIHDAELAVGG